PGQDLRGDRQARASDLRGEPVHRVPPVLRPVRGRRDGAGRAGVRADRHPAAEAAVIDLSYAEPQRIHLVWLALPIILSLGALERRSRSALGAFLSPVMQRRLTAQATATRLVVRLVLLLAAMVAAILALMRPQVRGETEMVSSLAPAADVMFVLD